MLDSKMRRWMDPALNRMGQALANRGIGANDVTLLGLGLGLVAAGIIAVGLPAALAILPLLLGRLADGLDGAVARATQKTDFGGFLDIACDFLFYAAVPFAFAVRAPDHNALAAAFLLASFYVNGASFLGFAVLAEKRGMQTTAQGQKSLYYSAGLLEGTETIAFFLALCFWPEWFSPLAWIFGLLCLATAGARLVLARRRFG